MGLNITVMSYCGQHGLRDRRRPRPDARPLALMDWLGDALEELLVAASGRPEAQGAGRAPSGRAASSWPTSSCARSAQSQRSGRVSRGSMISSTLKRSAVRNGERTASSRAGDLGAQRHRVVGRLELAPVGGLEAALDRQRAPVARRPGVAQVQARAVAVPGAGHAEHLAHQDRDPGHARLVDGEERRGRRGGSCPRARPRCRSRSRARPRSSRPGGGTGRRCPRSGRASPRRPR